MQNQEIIYYLFDLIPIWKVRQSIDINTKTVASRYYFLGLPFCKIIDNYLEEGEEIIDNSAD